MTLKEAIEIRESIRNYQEQSLNDRDYQQIEIYLSTLNLPAKLHFQLVKNVGPVFDSFKKSYGFFKGVSDAIVVYGKKSDLLVQEKSGYFGLQLSLYLVSIGIDNCFVGGTYDKMAIKMTMDPEDDILYVFAIGKRQAKELLRGEIVRKLLRRHHRNESYFIETNDVLPDWVWEGLHAMTLSPSATNRQGIILKYQNNQLSIYNKIKGPYDIVDLGIAKRLFEIATMKGKFEDGDHAVFQINESDEM